MLPKVSILLRSRNGGVIMSDEMIKVLVVKPMQPCRVQETSGLKDMQKIVGGPIQAVYPFQDPVVLVCHEEGKMLGLPFNRPLY